jgi:hypothetical protein
MEAVDVIKSNFCGTGVITYTVLVNELVRLEMVATVARATSRARGEVEQLLRCQLNTELALGCNHISIREGACTGLCPAAAAMIGCLLKTLIPCFLSVSENRGITV